MVNINNRKVPKVLDAKEYLYLAINAMSRNEHHAALNYLKEVLALEPQNANAIYLLAAEHAELGLFDRAIDEMEHALQLDPNIEVARFQLGLLYLRSNQIEKASEAFVILSNQTQTESLRAYADGLAALSRDNITTAREKLALGLSRTNDNPSLKKDMQELLDKLLDNKTDLVKRNQGDESEQSAFYLGAYGNKSQSESS